MNRRNFVAGIVSALALPFIKSAPSDAKNIEGVAVFRFPKNLDKKAMDRLKRISQELRQGTIVCLPNDRDYTGAYEWDFTIVAGDPKQVMLERAS